MPLTNQPALDNPVEPPYRAAAGDTLGKPLYRIASGDRLKKSQSMAAAGYAALIDPDYLMALPEPQEQTLLSQRTLFLTFHRYLYGLDELRVDELDYSCKRARSKVSQDSTPPYCCALALMAGALQFHNELLEGGSGGFTLAEQLNNPYSVDFTFAEQIAGSFHGHARLAEAYPAINSQHLVELAEGWLKGWSLFDSDQTGE